MPDKKDYDEYVVKVKRQNDKGEDLTGDDVGSGGRRREDGTLSAQYYDPRPYDPVEEEQSNYSDSLAPQRSELSPGQQMFVDIVSPAIAEILIRLTKDVAIPVAQWALREKVVPGVERLFWIRNLQQRHQKRRGAKHQCPKPFLRLCVVIGRT